ncbi:MAG: glycosyl hydrolase family 39 [Acidobacteriaceae bacterium]|nr:glycosyl hydrolase family 39 [Acidobacteriaceae bacterium]MBV9780437.1 glycosyl hydrolase family 39 [Acidobacteriaceae bacterium]
MGEERVEQRTRLLVYRECAAVFALFALGFQVSGQIITIDADAAVKPFPHFWEQTFGSGRAILSLRESYRRDLRELKKVTEFRYVRFHAILHDEVGVYDEDRSGKPVYNFSYVDQIYDGLLENGVRPFVEISFMPNKLAAFSAIHPFWYKQNVAPPKDYAKWDALISAFGKHLVDRYGMDEVSQWYFEVWNEPNIDFWAGEPKQATYFELYDHTARSLKAVNQRLRIGGPATAAAGWVVDFLKHCASTGIPIDFVSTHGYADDTVENLFHSHENIPMDERVCRAIQMVHGQIASSSRPELPLMWTEWNVPSFGPLNARDTIYVGAALASDIGQCDGFVNMMSFWTFDDVFEETGVVQDPFHGGFGLIAAGGIKKPSFNGFALLHKLGHQRIALDSANLLVTREGDNLVLAAWNLVDPPQTGSTVHLKLQFKGVKPNATVELSSLDEKHGNTLTAYEAMGKPRYPTRAQIDELNRAAELPPPSETKLQNGSFDIALSPNELLILELLR